MTSTTPSYNYYNYTNTAAPDLEAPPGSEAAAAQGAAGCHLVESAPGISGSTSSSASALTQTKRCCNSKFSTMEASSAIISNDDNNPRMIYQQRQPQSPSTPHLAVYKRRAWLLSFLVVLIGVGAGTAFLYTSIHASHQVASTQFENEAEGIFKSFKGTWEEFSITTLWMHETCRGSETEVLPTPSKSIGCTREEFQTFFDYISNSGLDFEAVGWVSNITHDERDALETESRAYHYNLDPNIDYKGIVYSIFDPNTTSFVPVEAPEKDWYFTQHYLLPSTEENVIIFADLDLSESRALWPMFQKTIQEMKPHVTFRLPKANELSYYVQMYHPGIESQHNAEYNGVAVCMVRVYDLLKRALVSTVHDLDVYIYDVVVPAADEKKSSIVTDEQALFMTAARISNGGQPLILPYTNRTTAIKATHRFQEKQIAIEDRVWLVLVTDPSNAYEYSLVVPIVGGTLIMVAAIIIAVCFFSSTNRAAKIQTIQAKAEAEKALMLEQMNRDLNLEVGQRVAELRESERLASEKAREAEQAEARSESMLQTMSLLSHELRTPLQGIVGITSMALSMNTRGMRSSSTRSIKPMEEKSISESETELLTGSTETETSTVMSYDSNTSRGRLQENLYTIQASSHLLLTLINNLLDFRKIKSGMMEKFEVECIDLAIVAKQCVDTLRPLASLSDVRLNITDNVLDKDSHWLAMGAMLPVQQVLINVVGNAIKYSSTSLTTVDEATVLDINIRKSTVAKARREAANALCCSSEQEEITTIQGDDDKEVLIVDVRDRGNGIPFEEAHKLFAAFMMLKQHDGKGKGFAQPTGSGLGLQLCASMMDMMDGCIWANNCDSPGASDALKEAGAQENDIDGCVFSFYLSRPSPSEAENYLNAAAEGFPLEFVQRQEPDHSHFDDFQTGGPRHVLIPKKIEEVNLLVVDDTLINLKVLRKMLLACGFSRIRCATSGVQALEMLREEPECDLVLTDYQMPGMSGVEFAQKACLFYSDQQKLPPFIAVCSADYSTSLTSLCAKAGIKAMLRKPITVKDLEMFVEKYCGSE